MVLPCVSFNVIHCRLSGTFDVILQMLIVTRHAAFTNNLIALICFDGDRPITPECNRSGEAVNCLTLECGQVRTGFESSGPYTINYIAQAWLHNVIDNF